MRAEYLIRPGQRFGGVEVLRRADKIRGEKRARWIVKCDCGERFIATGTNLRTGVTKSCGCARRYMARARTRTRIFGTYAGDLIIDDPMGGGA